MQFQQHPQTKQVVMVQDRPTFVQALIEIAAPTQDFPLVHHLMGFHTCMQCGDEAMGELALAVKKVVDKWANDPARGIVSPNGTPAKGGASNGGRVV